MCLDAGPALFGGLFLCVCVYVTFHVCVMCVTVHSSHAFHLR